MNENRQFPEDNCRHLAPAEERDPDSFIARMRFHQSWYRAVVLGCDAGPHTIHKNQKYGNMLTAEDGKAGGNFIESSDAMKHALDRFPGRGGKLSSYLYCNMLGSQAMCFNLFGPLKSDPQTGTQLLRLLPNAPRGMIVTKVKFEFAPPKEHHLNDNSSFDCFIEYERPEGVKGFIGIETKLTEPFTQSKFGCSRYLPWIDSSEWWRLPVDEDTFTEQSYNQLWRNHLLVSSMLQQDKPIYNEGYCAVVYPTGDTDCSDAISAYIPHLTKAGRATLLNWPLETIVNKWQTAVKSKPEEPWINEFYRRYLDLEASNQDFNNSVVKNASEGD